MRVFESENEKEYKNIGANEEKVREQDLQGGECETE